MHSLYNELMSETHRAERLKEAARARLARQVNLQATHTVSYRTWAYMLGDSLVQWGQSLKHFGTPKPACSLTSAAQPR